MSQTAVADRMVVPFEGRVESVPGFPNTILSGVASALIYFGKAVALADPTDVDPSERDVEMCASAADVTNLEGVAIADVSKEAISASYGGYLANESVSIMRKGRVWVVSEAEITDLTSGVFVRRANAGGSPPAASLGSFSGTTGADFTEILAGARWVGAKTVGSVYYGLLELNL